MTSIAKLGLAIIVFILLLIGGYFFVQIGKAPIPAEEPVNVGGNVATSTENSLIRISAPISGSEISSPLSFSGEARGNWYFEASFPVKVLDANGKELGVGIATAQGDWMTTEFVPFSGSVSFSSPVTETGTVVFEKDNPSGLPENADSASVAVRFSPSSVGDKRREVDLYFYNENKDRNAQGDILCSAQGLVAVEHSIPFTETPIQDSVRELLKGPTSSERLQAPNTEFPLAGLSLTGASLQNGVLTLSFDDPQNQTGGGSCRVNVLRAQIEATAKQFGGVSSVRFQPEELFQP